MLVLPLHQPHGLSSLEVGRVVQHLQPLLTRGIHLTPGLIIPVSTLRTIATHNQLEQKIEGLLNRHIPETQLADFFTKLRLPSEVSRELLRTLHQELDGWSATIRPSWVSSQPLPKMPSLPMKGEAVILEEILAQWGRATWVAAQSHITQPWFAAAIIIQLETFSPLQVTVNTTSSKGSKVGEVTVVSNRTQPSISDHYYIDVRTMQITHRLLDEPHHPLLSDTQILELMDQTYQVKRSILGHLQCNWELYDKTWMIQHCDSTDEPTRTQFTSTSPSLDPTAVVTGKTAITGTATARAYVTSAPDQLPTTWTTPIILVTPYLHHIHPSQLKHIVGVICERTPELHVYQTLQHLHIPTIVESKYATRLLVSDQHIHLDASKGTVRLQTTPSVVDTTITPLSIVTWSTEASQTELPTSDLSSSTVLATKQLNHASHVPGAHLRPASHSPVTWVALEWSPTRHSSHLADELQLLARAERFWPTQPHVITPGLHAPLEARHFVNQLQKSELGHQWPRWWQLETPENVLNVQEYLEVLQPRGLVINLHQLTYHLTGILFEDKSVGAMYPYPTGLVQHFLEPLSNLHEQHSLPIYWRIPQPTTALLEVALQQKVAGLMVSPYYVAETHRLLAERANRHATHLWQ